MNEAFKLALEHYGLTEIPGIENNQTILNFFKDMEQDWVKDDATAWCSAFVNAMAIRCGYERSNKLNARSWCVVGEEVFMPELGDIVVLWRESPESWKGHVGFYVSHDEKYVWVLGGNQDNMVCIKPYPRERVLRYKKLRKL